jgi:hypothetical protein
MLLAYRLPGGGYVPIVPAPTGRSWMRETNRQFAHRCLALLIANQAGWLLLNQHPVRITWDGGAGVRAVRIEYPEDEPEAPIVSSQFGQGILTWSLGYLFRTPPGYNLLARGPANLPKDGIAPLEGVVETDWAVASFTMNWKLTRPHHTVSFEREEPFCMIVPQRRYELEEFCPRLDWIDREPELAAQWREFDRRRSLMNGLRLVAARHAGQSGADRVPWERHYLGGGSPGGITAREHQKKLLLQPFEELRKPGAESESEPG